MNYAEIKFFDIANGPGVRLSLFVSGCTHECPGCFNQIAWPFDYGDEFTRDIEDKILDELGDSAYQGMTILGGEPFEPQNQKGLISLVKRFKERFPEKDLWIFSGYLFDKDMLGWMAEELPETMEILKRTDVIVDGEFKLALKDITLLYKGSSNQRTIDVQKSLKAGEVIQWDPGESTTVSSTAHL